MEVETGMMQLQPKNAWGHQKLEETRKDSPLGPSKGALFPANTLILAFGPPELWENTVLLLKATQDCGDLLQH